MNKLKYSVVIFNHDDEVTSKCEYPSRCQAQRKFDKAVTSAPCGNVGRIKLYERVKISRGFGLPPYEFNVLNEWYDNDRDNEPELQVAGYVVASVNTINEQTTLKPIDSEFFDDVDDAVELAKRLARKWSEKNPGLIVFKAIVHVHKDEYIPRAGLRILVDNVE